VMSLGLLGIGCSTTQDTSVTHSSLLSMRNGEVPAEPRITQKQELKSTVTANDLLPPRNAVVQTSAQPSKTRPVYAQLETLPIDLPTIIRLINENSPAIGYAQARVREAQARLESAELQWIPHLSIGSAYTRFDGQTQNQRGEIFGVSRANLFNAVVPTLSVDVAEAIYRPLIERRLTSTEQLREQATNLGAELDAVLGYLDLLQIHAQIEINVETLKNAEALLQAAKNAKQFNLDRTAGDVNRAQTEVLFRRVERMELEGKAGIASARLGKLLIMQPNVKLVPADKVVAPVTLIDPKASLDDLLNQATANRPDLAAGREMIEAAWLRVRRAERGPLWPKIVIANQTGAFGGGTNDDLQNFSSRNALSVQLYWEVRNLGLGNQADAAQRRAILDQARYQMIDTQARAAAEIVEAAQFAAARYEALELAEQAVKEATELFRINMEGMTNVIDTKNLLDALRPLQALQALNQARLSYLAAVSDFNRAQYRLFTAIGNAPAHATGDSLECVSLK
jgi:outer membrane protein TolC